MCELESVGVVAEQDALGWTFKLKEVMMTTESVERLGRKATRTVSGLCISVAVGWCARCMRCWSKVEAGTVAVDPFCRDARSSDDDEAVSDTVQPACERSTGGEEEASA